MTRSGSRWSGRWTAWPSWSGPGAPPDPSRSVSTATEPADLDQVVDYPRDARLKEATRTRREAEARLREAEGKVREAEGKLRDARRRERDLITKAREKAAAAERG